MAIIKKTQKWFNRVNFVRCFSQHTQKLILKNLTNKIGYLLERMRHNCNLHTLLVGIQNGTTTLEKLGNFLKS